MWGATRGEGKAGEHASHRAGTRQRGADDDEFVGIRRERSFTARHEVDEAEVGDEVADDCEPADPVPGRLLVEHCTQPGCEHAHVDGLAARHRNACL